MLGALPTDVARVTAWLFLLTALFIPLEHWFAERRCPASQGIPWADLYFGALVS